jgi:hypothetical protein
MARPPYGCVRAEAIQKIPVPVLLERARLMVHCVELGADTDTSMTMPGTVVFAVTITDGVPVNASAKFTTAVPRK